MNWRPPCESNSTINASFSPKSESSQEVGLWFPPSPGISLYRLPTLGPENLVPDQTVRVQTFGRFYLSALSSHDIYPEKKTINAVQ